MRRTYLIAALVLATCAPAAPGRQNRTGADGRPAELPPGHPDISRMFAGAPTVRLTVRAVRMNDTGPDLAGAPVEVYLFDEDRIAHQRTATLDEHGVATIEEIPAASPLRPLVRIGYAGVTYQQTGDLIGPDSPRGSVDVAVHDVTDEEPPWTIAMRHVIATPSSEGLFVTEMLVVENPGARTWLGAPPDETGKRGAVAVDLPESVRDITLESGFHGWCCTTYAGRTLTVAMPLMPGRSEYRYTYLVPGVAGRADLSVAARVPTQHVAMFVPSDGTTVEPIGLESISMGESAPGRLYQASGLEPRRPAGIIVASLPVTAAAGLGQSSARLWLTLAACGAIALIAAAALVLRSRLADRRLPGRLQVQRQGSA